VRRDAARGGSKLKLPAGVAAVASVFRGQIAEHFAAELDAVSDVERIRTAWLCAPAALLS
jgi:hypothetical protein